MSLVGIKQNSESSYTHVYNTPKTCHTSLPEPLPDNWFRNHEQPLRACLIALTWTFVSYLMNMIFNETMCLWNVICYRLLRCFTKKWNINKTASAWNIKPYSKLVCIHCKQHYIITDSLICVDLNWHCFNDIHNHKNKITIKYMYNKLHATICLPSAKKYF